MTDGLLETVPPFSEEGLALQFAEQHALDLRYGAARGRWFRWDGCRWREDDDLYAFDRAREVCRRAAGGANSQRDINALTRAQTVAAVEKLAKADRRIAAVISQWDSDPWALNTPGGIVDLRTGELKPSDPAAYCTKITAVAPAASGAQAPLFAAFLKRICSDDEDLVRFLKRVVGYSLTGSVSEHALFYGYGTGANGKGTLLNTITEMLGGYASVASTETFMASNSERHPTDRAMLHGSRFVCAQEVEEGQRWAESKIKSMTGGDPITARFMRQDFFTFLPTFKVFLAGNHKPLLRNVDEAIRRRLHLIPFVVTIPPAERDPNLAERLAEELPAILRWAIDGALEWQEEGLNPPPIVRDATADYLEAEDALGAWIEEMIEPRPGDFERTGDLFASWRKHAEAAGEHPGTERRFAQNFQSRGFEPKRTESARGFADIRLRRPDYSDDPRWS